MLEKDKNGSEKIDVKERMPQGIPYIIGNELAERFSYYGMRTILTVFMTTYLLDSQGNKDVMTDEESKVWYHLFSSANYLLPILGAVFADVLWGKYKTIIALSIVYCLGHLALSLDDTRLGLSLGLTMIAIGSGGIKPCVSALLGDQFKNGSKSLMEKVFNMFYLSINLGSGVSTVLTPYLLRHYGASVAFGVPGALMIIATFIFWLGRNRYTSPPPTGVQKYIENFKDKEVLKTLSSLLVIYFFMAIFWALYEQTPSSWVIQAQSVFVDKNIDLNLGLFNFQWLRFNIFPEQLQALNPVFVLILVPVFSFGLYPLISKVFPLTPLRKISIGMFVTALSFVIIAFVEGQIKNGITVSILWQAVAYFVLTAAEVMVYGTGLEFSYSQAPKNMKSFIMGLFLLSISAGNLITAGINYFIQNADGTSKLAGATYYWFFVGMMLITAFVFIFVAQRYKESNFAEEV